jgi:16S rRNA (cytidine1402-2'-O)-methyltransferase
MTTTRARPRSAVIYCLGHPNIRATHAKTIELTGDTDVTLAGTCIVGVAAQADSDALLALRGPVVVRLACGGIEDRVRARIDPTYRRSAPLILRCYDKPQPRTLCIAADKGAAALDRDLVEELRRPGAELVVTIEELGQVGAADAALFVVAAPIGEPDDLSPRARDVLSSVDLILAEDTRSLAEMAPRTSYPRRVLSYFDHNERDRAAAVLEHLSNGARVALVTEAGTPIISDPGFHLIRAAAEAGVTVTPVPGPSAVTAALSVSAFSAVDFRFVGFPPRKAQARRTWLAGLADAPSVLILFEAEHRLLDTLADIAAIMDDRMLALCNDLTKPREAVLRGRPSQVRAQVEEAGGPRGEFTLVLDAPSARTPPEATGLDEAMERFLAGLIAGGVPTKALARALADATGRPRRDAFDLVVRLKDRAGRDG